MSQLIDYNPQGDDILAKAMRRVSRHWPMAYSRLLSLRWEWSTATPYGATDGRRLLLNQAGLGRLQQTDDPTGLAAFLLIHESLHALLSHAIRLKKFKDKETANVAADYIINAMIAAQNEKQQSACGYVPFPMIEGVLFDISISGDKSTEELYEELMRKKDAEPPPPTAGGEPQPAATQPDPNAPTTPPTNSEVLGDEWVGQGGVGDLTEPEVDVGAGETIDDVVRDIELSNERTLLEDAVNKAATMNGSGGAEKIHDLNHQQDKLDWADHLRDWAVSRSLGGWDKPYNAPIHQSTGLISAGRESKAITCLAVVVDTSGSMSDKIITDILESIQDALEVVQPDTTHIFGVSNRVRDHYEVPRGGRVPNRLTRGGGTQFQVAFDHIAGLLPENDGIIYLTDGRAADFTTMREPETPVMWLTYGIPAANFPFGEAINITLHQ